MLCQHRSTPRKLAVQLLKDCKQLLSLVGGGVSRRRVHGQVTRLQDVDRPVIDVLDSASGHVLEVHVSEIAHVDMKEWPSPVDFATMCERVPLLEVRAHVLSRQLVR